MQLTSQNPYPIIVYSVANYRSQLSVFVNWPFFFRLNEEHFTFHLQYKHCSTFANRKYKELSYHQNPKMCDPIQVTLLKMWPHYSQFSCENATPSSGTSPLASYKEAPPSPSRATRILVVHNSSANIKRKLLVVQHQWKMVFETLDDKLSKDMRRINIVPVWYN